MIDYHQFCQIKDLHQHRGLHAAQIAETLALDPRTVAYWLGQERFRPRKSTSRQSKLDPFKAQIVLTLFELRFGATALRGLDFRFRLGGAGDALKCRPLDQQVAHSQRECHGHPGPFKECAGL